MHIMLTGHCGYIGSALLARLKKENSIVGFDLQEGQDLLTIPLRERFDVIIHLAGSSGVRESLNNPSLYWNNNVEVTKRILELYGAHTRIIFASSSSAYEPDLNPYAASKYCIERAAAKYPNTLGLRLHTVFSANPRKGMFLQKLLDNQLEYVTNHYRDYIHLEDVCDTIEKCITSNLKGIMDVGTGITTSIRELSPRSPVRLNTVGEREVTCANTKLLSQLGIKPKYNITDFLSKYQ